MNDAQNNPGEGSRLLDAHTHLHFARLAPVLPEVLAEARAVGLQGAVVNGTCEGDWEAVRKFCAEHPWARPAYGIHPWQAPRRRMGWEKRLREFLAEDGTASVGEIGLDNWVADADPADQRELFIRQWKVARDLERPATVHCVRAWPELRGCLRRLPGLPRGFLLHAYNGPVDWIPFFAEKGARFSFSPYFLMERKKPQREAFRVMPRERILIETDAPEMSPAGKVNPRPLTSAEDGQPLNHPANLETACTALADVLGLKKEEAAEVTAGNWEALFGKPYTPR